MLFHTGAVNHPGRRTLRLSLPSMTSSYRTLCAALAAATLASGCATRPAPPLELNLVALNDFHGHLEANKFEFTSLQAKPQTVLAGGIDNLGGALKAWRAEDPELLLVGAGDLVGASPALSSMWADEPTITALSMLGLRVSAVGNHEFDQGRNELLRQQNGGCVSRRPHKACKFTPGFKGASFAYLAANVVDSSTGKPMLPAFRIEQVKGVKIAFIGAVVRGAHELVLASGIEGLSFTDEADAINLAKMEAARQGATVFVVLIHEGGRTEESFDQPNCEKLKGPIVDIARRLDPELRLIVSGHTHKGFQCSIDGRTITQAEMGGHVLSRIKLTVDGNSHALRSVDVRNVAIKAGDFPPDPALAEYLKTVKARSAAALIQPVARLAVRTLSKQHNKAGEALLGDLIADGVLDATRSHGAEIGFMNMGGIRKDLDVGPDLVLTHGQAQVVLPFSNTLVLLDMSGAEIRAVLEQQWQRANLDNESFMLQVSAGLHYTWNRNRPLGQHIVPGSLTLNGAPLDDARIYKVVVNNFLAEGGDGFPQFARAANKRDTNLLDLDAFVAHLAKLERAGQPAGAALPARIERVE